MFRVNDLPHFTNCHRGSILVFEYTGAAHNHIRARLSSQMNIRDVNAAINLQIQHRTLLTQLTHLRELLNLALLPTKARLDRHDQNHVKQ